MGKIKKAMLQVARSRPMGRIVRFAFAHAVRMIPLRRRAQSETAVAFDHPVPVVEGHVLIVPKRGIPGLDAMRDVDQPWLDGFVVLAFELLGRRAPDWVLLVNGGPWQDVRQLHGHLLPADAVGLRPLPAGAAEVLPATAPENVMAHPEPAREGHWLIQLAEGADANRRNRLVLGQAAAESVAPVGGYALVLDPRSPFVQLIAGGSPSADDAAGVVS